MVKDLYTGEGSTTRGTAVEGTRNMDDARIAAMLALVFGGGQAGGSARVAGTRVYSAARDRGFLSEEGYLTRKGRALLARHPWRR